MAARHITVEQIARRLPYTRLMLEELHDQADRWLEMPEWERADWSLEWAQFINILEEIITPAYESGIMTPEQQGEYRRLVVALKDARPVMERIHMAVPGVALESAA